MVKYLEDIRNEVGEDNVTSDCSRDCCEVSLEGVAAERLIVDVDAAFPALGKKGKRCDFIVFLEFDDDSLLVAPLELKSGGFDASDVLRQLRSGAKFGEELSPKNNAPYCRPVLIHGKPLGTWQRKKLNEAKIPFRGSNITILTARCGQNGNLAEALCID